MSTQTQLFFDLMLWFIVWISVWAFFLLYLIKHGISYTKGFWKTSLYFLGAIFLPLIFFGDKINSIVQIDNNFPTFTILATFLFTLVIYYVAPKILKRPNNLIRNSPNAFFLLLDFRYLISKTFEIIFQQVGIIILIVILLELELSLSMIIFMFAILFGGAHIGLFKTEGKFWGSYFFIFSIFSAFLFPILILNVNYGFIYAFIVHWIFYIISGVVFWIYEPRNYKMVEIIH